MSENKENLDVSTLPGFEDVRNILYKVLADQLMQPSLHEQIGYDLANCMFNMDYHLLPEKHRKGFDNFVYKLLCSTNRLSLLSTDLLDTEEELAVFRQKYLDLKEKFNVQTSRPQIVPKVDQIEVRDESHSMYGRVLEVTKVYYNPEFASWMVTAKTALTKNSFHTLKASQIVKV
jgi:hypothetical protein